MRLLFRIVVLSCLIGVAYANVWQRVQTLRLGYQISGMEGRKGELIREHRLLWLELCRLGRLERVENLSKAELHLVAPEKLEIIEVVRR